MREEHGIAMSGLTTMRVGGPAQRLVTATTTDDLVDAVHGLCDAELAELARSSVRGSRAPAPARSQMLADIDRWLAG